MLTEGTVAQYLKEIRKYRLLTFEEEKALSLRVENDDQEALEELFWFKQKDDAEDLHQNNFNSNWIRLTDLDGEIVDCEGINDEGRGYVYIFGYHVRIKPGETTATLFDKVQNKKYGSKTIAANEKELIRIESYAIQADDILESGITVNTTGEISAEDLSYIYQTFFNQNVDALQ